MALAMIFRRMTPVVVAAAAMALLVVPADAAIPTPPPVDVAAAPGTAAAIGLRVDTKRLRFGQRVQLRSRLVTASTGDGIGGESVDLYARQSGSDVWRVVGSRTTAVGGRVEWTLRPDTSSNYRVVHAATPDFSRAVSEVRRVEMAPLITARLSKPWARQSGKAAVRGRVRPSFRGDAVNLEKRVDGSWRRVARDQQNADGEYSIRVGSWAKRGTYHYRVVVPTTKAHRQATSERLALDVVRVVTYQIETRGRIVASMKTFRERVAEIYADKRGWSRAYVHFKKLKRVADFSVVLAQAEYVPRFAPICDAYWSCRVGRYVIINQDRWRFGTPYFLKTGATLAQYRAMVVDHETGHWFGLGHATCSKRGALAPVMMQQSKGLFGCKPNPWPLPGEIARVR